MACTTYDDASRRTLVKGLLSYIDQPRGSGRGSEERRLRPAVGRDPAEDPARGRGDRLGRLAPPGHAAARARDLDGPRAPPSGRPSTRRPVSAIADNHILSPAGGGRRPGDRIFQGIATGAGVLILVVLAGVAGFLLIEAWPAITAARRRSRRRRPRAVHLAARLRHPRRGHDRGARRGADGRGRRAVHQPLRAAPDRERLSYAIDLLAAVPSIVYGLWGIAVLGPASTACCAGCRTTSASCPSSRAPPPPTGRTMLVAGLVLGVMILPIVTAVARAVFTQTPAPAAGGRAGAGRDPLGDDPPDRPALRALGDHQRRDARPRARARGDDGRRDPPLGLGRRHLQPDRLRQPVDDRRATSRSTSPSPPGSTSTR